MPPRTGPRRPGLPAVLDAVLAVCLAAVGLVSLWTTSALLPVGPREPDGLGVLLVLVGAAAVAVRRRVPVAALAVSLTSSVLVLHLGYHQVAGGLTALLSLYTVAVQRPARVSAALTAVTVLAATAAVVSGPSGGTVVEWVANAVVFVTAWALGRSVRARRARIADLEAGSRTLAAMHDAERRAALAEERAAIAREMQDLVAHSLAEVTVQLAAATRLVGHDADTAGTVLASAEHTGRRALAETRRIVDLLAPGELADGRQPLPGLDDLPTLLAAEQALGRRVSLVTSGPPGLVPSGVGLTCYRLVQERLAAAGRRDPTPVVEIRLAWETGTFSVQVRDDGVGPDTGAGVDDGIAMRLLQRRAELYGGCLCRDEGSVTAMFPMDSRED